MTATWLEVVNDSRGVYSIYGDEAPSLRAVSLHELVVHRDGPRATLRFDLPEFPAVPPKKWAAQGFNVVQVELMFAGVRSINMEGWTSASVVDLSIRQEGDDAVGSSTGDTRLHVAAQSAVITSLSAYRDEQ